VSANFVGLSGVFPSSCYRYAFDSQLLSTIKYMSISLLACLHLFLNIFLIWVKACEKIRMMICKISAYPGSIASVVLRTPISCVCNVHVMPLY
jgi:hypothetical protein